MLVANRLVVVRSE